MFLYKLVVMDGRTDLYPVTELLEDTFAYSCLSVHILFTVNSRFHFSPQYIFHEINALRIKYVGMVNTNIALGVI